MSDEPSRDLILWAVELGWLTRDHAERLDAWAGELATELMEGRLTEAELHARINARVLTDLARRGKA